MKYLVKYSAGIGTKSSNTKRKFIKRLEKNTQAALVKLLDDSQYKQCKFNRSFNHLELTTPTPVDHVLTKISGIQYFSRAHEIDFHDLEQLTDEAKAFFSRKVSMEGTFAVRCRKTGNTSVTRKEVEIRAGDKLIPFGNVNLDNPAVTCIIEIRDNKVFFYDHKIPGPGGLPLGVQGKALTLFSGGIDSPVASWMIYNTGLDQDFLYFDLGSEEQKEKTVNIYRYLLQNWGHGANSRLIIIDFVPAVIEILKAKKPFQNLILKYFFYKAAEKAALYHRIPALATGEAIGQVSTQTLQNLASLDQVTSLLIIRPLSNLTKAAITQKARETGTFELAYKGREFCALTAKNVVTNSSFKTMMNEVETLDISVIEDAVEARRIHELFPNRKVKDITRRKSKKPETPAEKKDSHPALEYPGKIIDLRPALSGNDFTFPGSEHIPFRQAWQEYLHWNKDQPHYLVCETGSQSKILAHHMREEGFKVSHLEGGIKQYLEKKKTDKQNP